MKYLVLASALALPAAANDDPSDTVERFYEAYRSRDANALVELYAEDASFTDVSQRHHAKGREELAAMLTRLTSIHVDMQIEEKRRMVSGDRVVLEIEYQGTLDCAKLGRPDHPNVSYALPTVIILETKNGKIEAQTDYIDFRTFTETFSFLQPPAETSGR